MNFIEETLGAQLVRKITFSLAVLAGIFALTVLIINNEVVSGLLVLYTVENFFSLNQDNINRIL